MNIIKPDHKILRALLEEDEDFKIELKANIIRSAIKGETVKLLGGDVKRAVEEESLKVRDDLFVSQGWKKGKWSWSPTQEMKDEIRSEILALVRAEIQKQVKAVLPEVDQWIEDSISDSIKLAVKNGVKSRLEEVAKELKD